MLWIVAHQAPLPMGFSRQEYWSGLPFPPPRGFPNPGMEPLSLMFPAFVFLMTSTTWEACVCVCVCVHLMELPEREKKRGEINM